MKTTISRTPHGLLTGKRSAQAGGSGVKERSSRTSKSLLYADLDGAQRLEGRRSWICPRCTFVPWLFCAFVPFYFYPFFLLEEL